MCGLIGIVGSGHHSPDISSEAMLAARDRMRHRGPDDAGEWSDHHAWLGHRRLAIMDPRHGGAPFVVDPPSGDRCVVAFNGELLNHRELRRTLESEGASFRTNCDGETAAVALAHWDIAALDRFHGMFAVAWYRPVSRRLVLARDPFGVVPLYFRVDDETCAFASELAVLAELGPRRATPDFAVVSGYLSTIRVTLGERTMIEGLRTVLPGRTVQVDLGGETPHARHERWWQPPTPTAHLTGSAADDALRTALTTSLAAHLQSDVEVCGLLSGGVDSAVLTALASERIPDLRTFTAVGGDGRSDPDRSAAALVAEHLGLRRLEVDVDRTEESPSRRWRRMVKSLGMPLGTPNELAINALAEGVAASGVKVAIGGEGADELLGGYEPVLRIVASVTETARRPEEAATALLNAMSWLAPIQKTALLQPAWMQALDDDRLLFEETTHAIDAGGRPDRPRTYLRWLQEVNLTGLLGRLNHATMLASVETRPPFADRGVADAVASIATDDLFRISTDPSVAAETKTVLRRAFGDRVPASIRDRPKASFPTPFQDWARAMLLDAEIAEATRPLLLDGVVDAITAPESPLALLAWPMANLGVWSIETGVPLDP